MNITIDGKHYSMEEYKKDHEVIEITRGQVFKNGKLYNSVQDALVN